VRENLVGDEDIAGLSFMFQARFTEPLAASSPSCFTFRQSRSAYAGGAHEATRGHCAPCRHGGSPFSAHAQQQAEKRIGVLVSAPADDPEYPTLLNAFRQRLENLAGPRAAICASTFGRVAAVRRGFTRTRLSSSGLRRM
jgi:hypothetical protein